MADGTRQENDGSEHLASRVTELEARVGRVEALLAGLGEEVRTRRVVVLDAELTERLVVETTQGVLELRISTTPAAAGRRTELLLFAAPGDEALDLPPGLGVQLWAVGDTVDEMTWWSPDG